MIKLFFRNKFLYLIIIFIISFGGLFFVINNDIVMAAPQPGDANFIGPLPLGQGSPYAQGGSSNGNLQDPFAGKTIFTIIQNIIGYLIKIGAPILAIMVIYGGFLILTAGDSPEKVKSGKDVILWAVVGYIIVLCSWGVIYIMGEIITNKSDAFISTKK